jgi:hypothetical protein
MLRAFTYAVSPLRNIQLYHCISCPLVLEVACCCPKRIPLPKLVVVAECAVTMLDENAIVAILRTLMDCTVART